jgi:hypothetical protein
VFQASATVRAGDPGGQVATDQDGGELVGDPDIAGAAGALREEWRAEEEEYTRAAMTRWTHERRLADIARELVHRGDTVTVAMGNITFTGEAVSAGPDFLQLRTTAGGRVDVNLAVATTTTGREVRVPAPLVIRVVERARAGGRSDRRATTFRARLLEREADGDAVVVGSMLLDEQLEGVLTVGRDYVCVRGRDGCEAFLPIGWTAWVAHRVR